MPYLPAAAAVRSRLMSDIVSGKLRLGVGVGALELVAVDAARLADDEAEVQVRALPWAGPPTQVYHTRSQETDEVLGKLLVWAVSMVLQ